MIHGVKYFNNDVRYLKKEHFCPDCKSKLETVKVTKVVNHKSPEAKDFDFGLGTGTGRIGLLGNIKFVWKEFECPSCKRHLSVKEMKELEGVCEERVGSGIGGKITFAVCVIILIIVAIVKKYILTS